MVAEKYLCRLSNYFSEALMIGTFSSIAICITSVFSLMKSLAGNPVGVFLLMSVFQLGFMGFTAQQYANEVAAMSMKLMHISNRYPDTTVQIQIRGIALTLERMMNVNVGSWFSLGYSNLLSNTSVDYLRLKVADFSSSFTRTSPGQAQSPTVVPNHSIDLPSEQLKLTVVGGDQSAAMRMLGDHVTTILCKLS
ncbi:uncharacterized protein [Palaemon carinicauda]|uniref:uncharacterized protein n=1 Tax=Palaemon carinicauda TaxID=392227 RepID=UPI0035B60222